MNKFALIFLLLTPAICFSQTGAPQTPKAPDPKDAMQPTPKAPDPSKRADEMDNQGTSDSSGSVNSGDTYIIINQPHGRVVHKPKLPSKPPVAQPLPNKK